MSDPLAELPGLSGDPGSERDDRPPDPGVLDPPKGEGPAPVPPAVPARCWRCGKDRVPAQTFCPHCRARLAPDPVVGAAPSRKARTGPPALAAVLWVFVWMLLTSLVFGWVHDFGLDYDLAWDPEQLRLLLNHMLTLELVDTLLVGVVLYWMGRPSALARPPVPRRLATWAAAVPLLLVALAVNFGYHFLLREFLAVPPWKDELVAWSGLSAWIWLAYCVQPAVVEELFFRYLALGTLRGYMGVHGAVLISSVMFGMAHIGMPLSIPLLTGIGVVFGYVRVASGSLLLPILMHFGHNAAILLLEAWL